MTYVTGSATSISDLKTNIVSACTSNGWSSDGDVIWKGSSYFEITVSGDFVEIYGGTGQSGGVISGKSPHGARIGGSYVTFPVTYEVNLFTGPDEVYAVVNYNSDYYQQMSFGTTDVAGATEGPWFTGAHNTTYTSSNNGISMNMGFNSGGSYCFASVSTNSMGLFNYGFWSGEVCSSFVYTDANGTAGWYGYNSGATAERLREGSVAWVAGLLGSLPNEFTNTNVLLPIKALLDMTSNGRATVANLRNARFGRIDYNAPGEILTYGSEKWKIYPFLKKNSAVRNGVATNTSTPEDHSGTYAYAIKYTGP